MTKKSDARLARDAQAARRAEAKTQLKDNKCWDELNGLYAAAVELLLSHRSLALFLAGPRLRRYLADPVTTIQAVQSLAADLNTLNTELAEIYAQHDGKTGGSQEPDEVWRAIEIHEMYNLFTTRHDAVVMPTVAHLAELLDEANARREQAEAPASAEAQQAQAQDPHSTAPIDVVSREPSAA